MRLALRFGAGCLTRKGFRMLNRVVDVTVDVARNVVAGVAVLTAAYVGNKLFGDANMPCPVLCDQVDRLILEAMG